MCHVGFTKIGRKKRSERAHSCSHQGALFAVLLVELEDIGQRESATNIGM
jgi:hypothetical protein